jgi:hypothetical protein
MLKSTMMCQYLVYVSLYYINYVVMVTPFSSIMGNQIKNMTLI